MYIFQNSMPHSMIQDEPEGEDEEMDLSEVDTNILKSSHHLVRILRELFNRLPQNTPGPRNLLAVFDAGFEDDDDEEAESNIPGMDTKTLCELLGVDKSTVSRARNDSENLLLSVKYPPGVTRDRMDPQRIQMVETVLNTMSEVHSGTKAKYCRFNRIYAHIEYHNRCVALGIIPLNYQQFCAIARLTDVNFVSPRTHCDLCEELHHLEQLDELELTDDDQRRLEELREHRRVSVLSSFVTLTFYR